MLACLMTPPAYASGCNFVTLASRYAAAAHVVTAIVVNEYVVNDGGFETEHWQIVVLDSFKPSPPIFDVAAGWAVPRFATFSTACVGRKAR